MSREKQIDDKNCNECLHFEACCKWTDFPKQIGFPVCRKFAPTAGYRKQSEGEWTKHLDEWDCAPYEFLDERPNAFGQAQRAGIRKALRCVSEAPAADVAPKSEVEALLKENERWMTEYANYREGVREVIKEIKIGFARQIFEEIEKHLFVIAPLEEFDGQARLWLDDLMRIKKKYTEEPNV